MTVNHLVAGSSPAEAASLRGRSINGDAVDCKSAALRHDWFDPGIPHHFKKRNIMTPLRNNIIVSRVAAEKQTSSGIILKTAEGPDRAKVIALGPKVDEVQIGDEVLLNWNQASKIDNETYVVPITEVIFIF